MESSGEKNTKLSDSNRQMQVVAAVEEWNRGLSPSAIESKYEKLGESPLSFFIGTNHLFWADFSGDERLSKFGNEATVTWISGDCHIGSFGASGSDLDGPMYGLDLLDESVIADYQYDVWRFAISIILAAKANGGAFTSESDLKDIILAFSRHYLQSVVNYKHAPEKATKNRLSTLLSYTAGNIRGRLVRFLAIVEREYSRKKLLKKWVTTDGTKFEFVDHETIQPCTKLESDAISTAFGYYTESKPEETVQKLGHNDGVNIKLIARRVNASVPSIGIPRYIILGESSNGELHLLDVSMQQKPTAFHFMRPEDRKSYKKQFKNDASRLSSARTFLSSYDDAFNGWIQLNENVHPSLLGFYSVRDISPYEEHYPVLELSDVKSKFKPFILNSKEAWVELAENWARILGNQHAYAAAKLSQTKPNQSPPFSLELSKIMKTEKGAFEELVVDVARTYADQVERDWQALCQYLSQE